MIVESYFHIFVVHLVHQVFVICFTKEKTSKRIKLIRLFIRSFCQHSMSNSLFTFLRDYIRAFN